MYKETSIHTEPFGVNTDHHNDQDPFHTGTTSRNMRVEKMNKEPLSSMPVWYSEVLLLKQSAGITKCKVTIFKALL